MEMPVEEINAKGGINGEKVVLRVRDDALDTTKAALQNIEEYGPIDLCPERETVQ